VLLPLLTLCEAQSHITCDHNTTTYYIDSNGARVTFRGGNPSFDVSYPNITSEYYITVKWDILAQPNLDQTDIIYSFPAPPFLIECVNASDPTNDATISFTSIFPNNSTVSLTYFLHQNISSPLIDPDTRAYLDVGGVGFQLNIQNWTNTADLDDGNYRPRVELYLATSESVLDLFPSYYSDTQQLRLVEVSAPGKNVEMYLSQESGFTDSINGQVWKQVEMWVATLSLSPPSGQMTIKFPFWYNNQTLVYTDAVGFVSVGPDQNVLVILLSVGLSLLLIVGVIALVIFLLWRKHPDMFPTFGEKKFISL